MLFLVVLVIALGWAGWFWSWGRDRFVSNAGLGLPPNPYAPLPVSALAPPRNAAMARRRRREVLGTLGLLALLTLLVARVWSPAWVVNVPVVLAFAGYACAVYSIERAPHNVREPVDARMGVQPVLDSTGPRNQPAPGPQPQT